MRASSPAVRCASTFCFKHIDFHGMSSSRYASIRPQCRVESNLPRLRAGSAGCAAAPLLANARTRPWMGNVGLLAALPRGVLAPKGCRRRERRAARAAQPLAQPHDGAAGPMQEPTRVLLQTLHGARLAPLPIDVLAPHLMHREERLQPTRGARQPRRAQRAPRQTLRASPIDRRRVLSPENPAADALAVEAASAHNRCAAAPAPR